MLDHRRILRKIFLTDCGIFHQAWVFFTPPRREGIGTNQLISVAAYAEKYLVNLISGVPFRSSCKMIGIRDAEEIGRPSEL